MGPRSGNRALGLRHGLWLGAACVLLLAVSASIMLRFEGPQPPPAPPSEPLATQPPPEPGKAPEVARREPPSPPVKRNAPPPRAEVLPPPAPAGEQEPPAPSPQETLPDPFELQDNGDSPIRTLVSVGDIQLGVVRESARIRDEAGLKKVLVQIGDDLERRMREQQGQGASGLQQVLDDYREELGQHMSGEVELRGPGWMIGTEVGPPQPREEWWVPRKQ